jgi:threonine synthase
MTAAAFAGFNNGQEPPLPLKNVGGKMLLETGEGPTLAFKDIGQQVVAQLLNYYLGRRNARANILVETSGDTGPAAVAGVRGCPFVDIFCLYPSGRVSPVQELQLITVDEENVHVYCTEGNTDEQAEVLKEIFMDEEFMAKYNVCSINSINWARIAAQSSYYVWAYLQMCPDLSQTVDFVIPTGAFGNSMGGYLAKKMGLPVGTMVCATNANDTVTTMLNTGLLKMGVNVETGTIYH